MHQSQSVGIETKLKVFLNMTTYAYTLPLPGDIFCTHWWVPYVAKLITKTY